MERFQNAAPDHSEYVRRLGRVVADAMRVRGQLIQEFSQLDQNPATAMSRAGRIGARCAPAFEEARRALTRLPSRPEARAVRDPLLDWIEVHVQACDALMRAAGTRDPRHVGTAATLLRQAQPYAHRYNTARRRLAQRLVA